MSNTEKSTLFPPWKELVKVASEWDYGTFHSHAEIGGILGCEPQSSKYYAYVQKARRSLIERGKLLEAHTNQGYYVTEVNRYSEVTFEDVKKSKKYLEISVLKSQFAPTTLMDEQAKKKHDVFLVKQVGLLNMSMPFYTEVTKIISPIPKRFRLNEAKPKRTDVNEDN